jgi:small conductance mechanosensitive channel
LAGPSAARIVPGHSNSLEAHDMDWQDILDKARQIALDYGPQVVAALATLVLGWIGAKIARAILRKVMTRARVDVTLIGFTTNMVYMLLLAFVFISALGALKVETGSFVAIVGAAGLAIGFALQGSLANLAAGVMIIIFRPFRVGEFIEAAGTTGDVVEIQTFSTILNTKDNKRIVIPNGQLMGNTIINYSANPTRRVDMVMGIGYGDDIKKAKDLLMEILKAHPLVLDKPEPAVGVASLGDSSVNLNVRPWCKPADYFTVWSEITEAVKLRFDAEGISIPFPQRDVHLHQVA